MGKHDHTDMKQTNKQETASSGQLGEEGDLRGLPGGRTPVPAGRYWGYLKGCRRRHARTELSIKTEIKAAAQRRELWAAETGGSKVRRRLD